MAINPDYKFLQSIHPTYVAWKDVWAQNERRMRGGRPVLEELRRFDWELPGGEHYTLRQDTAVYLNFPDLFATALIGQLMKKAPRVDEGSLTFGGLGEVRGQRNPANPTRAELVFYNTDGVGNDGSQWNNFWATSTRWAMATGHRWIMVEGPVVEADVKLTKADEQKGARPYIVSLSPLTVTNWHFENGRLAWAIITRLVRKPRLKEGEFIGNTETVEYLLMVREGVKELGSKFTSGGWWKFDNELNTTGDFGDWTKTKGEIPMFPQFYERDSGEVYTSQVPQSNSSGIQGSIVKWPAMSRPGVTELGNAAVAYMNLSSAADFDAWDAAVSIQFIVGADEEGFNLAMSKLNAGSRYVPVPINRDAETTPTIHDGSTGAVVSDVFEKRLATKRTEVSRLAETEASKASGAADASGVSQQADFAGSKAPRLALMASELEQAQNTAIWFLELRWGIATPTGFVEWGRDFSLIDVLDSVNSFLALQKLAGVTSKTLTAKALVMAARSRDLISDETEAEAIKTEYEDSADSAQKVAEAPLLTPDGAQRNGTGHGVGGDGTAAVPGQTRFGSVGAKSKNNNPKKGG